MHAAACECSGAATRDISCCTCVAVLEECTCTHRCRHAKVRVKVVRQDMCTSSSHVEELCVALHVSEVGSTGFVVGLHECRDDAALCRYCVLQ